MSKNKQVRAALTAAALTAAFWGTGFAVEAAPVESGETNGHTSSVVIGENSSSNDGSTVVIGSNASAVGSGTWGSVVLGKDSTVSWNDLNNPSASEKHDPYGVVSVGKSGDNGFQRRIINVADGTNDTDAVNKGQLDAATEGTVKWDENTTDTIGGVKFEGTGYISAEATNDETKTSYTYSMGPASVQLAQTNESGKKTAMLKADGVTFSNNSQDTRFGSRSIAIGNTGTVGYGIDYQKDGKSIFSVDANGKVTAVGAGFGSVSINAGGNGKVTGLTDGTLSAASTDAVTGRQLYAVSQGLTANEAAVETLQNAGIVAGTTTAGLNSVAVGPNSAAAGAASTAIGSGTKSAAWSSAYGAGANAAGYRSTAIGVSSKVEANSSVALGDHSEALVSDILKTDKNGVVSVGKAGSERRVINVADGVNTYDAVNKGQLDKKADLTALTEVDTAWKAWQTSMNNAGIVAGTTTAGLNSVAVGPNSAAAGAASTAIGSGTKSAAWSSAYGAGANAAGYRSTAIGVSSKVEANSSVAIGDHSEALVSDILKTDKNGVVSVGKAGSERRVINVADGVNTYDAVNKGQLDAVNEDVLTNASNLSSLGEKVGIADFSRTNYAKGDTVTQAIYGLDGQIKTNADAIAANAGDIELLEGLAVQYDDVNKGTITLGGTGGTTITNLKAGVNDSDAVNYGQLRPVETYANSLKDAGLTGGSLTATGKLASTLGSTALGTGSHILAAGTDGIWGLPGSAATATTSMAIGNLAGINVTSAALSSASANSALALGSGAQITAGSAGGSAALADSSIAIGTGATITATGVLGSSGDATNSVALGTGASVYNASGSVALGSGSTVAAGEDNVISVGKTGSERKIIHVADGALEENSKDAVNGGQLYTTNQAVAALNTYTGIGTDLSNGAANLAAGINTNYDLIQKAQTEAEKHTTVTGKSDNVIIHPSTNEDGSENYDVSLNPHLTLTSIANENGNGINLAEATMKLGSVSIQNGVITTAKVTGLADGVEDSDAVNKGQLDTVDEAWKAYKAAMTASGIVADGNIASGMKDVIAIGNSEVLGNGDGSLVIGNGGTVAGKEAVGLGNHVIIGNNAENSVALGSGSVVYDSNTVSVGSDTIKRTISNVANGVYDNDAVNMSQLNAVQTEAEKHTTITGKSDNIIIHPSTNEDGSTNYDVALNPHLTLTSIANENGNGINLAEATMKLGSVSIQDGDVKTAEYSLNDIGWDTGLIERTDNNLTKIGNIVGIVGEGAGKTAGLYVFDQDNQLAHKFSVDGSAVIGEVTISKDGAITAAGGTKIGDVLFKQTKDGEGNTLTTISGVADGVYGNDAVNKSQLDAVQTEAGKHTTLTSSDSNVVLTKTDTDGQLNYDVAINPNLTVTSVSDGNNRIDLAAGTASLLNANGQGLTISGGSTLLNYGTSSLMTSASGTTIASDRNVFMVGSNGTSIFGALNYNGWTNVLDGIDNLKTVTRLDGTMENVSSLPQYMQANREDILTLNSQVQDLSGTVTGLSKNSVQYDSDDHSSVSFDGANGTALNNVSSINGQGDSKLDLGENGATLSNGGSSLTVNGNGVTANGDLTVNGDTTMNGSLSVNGGNGNSLTVDSTGTHVVGDFTVNGSTVATEKDVSDIKNSLGDGKFTNEGLTYTDAINKNTAGIAENAGAIEDTRNHIGVDANGNFAALTNGGTTITDAINKNTDSITNLNTTVGDGKLDNGAKDLTSGINANTAAINQNSNAIGELGRSVNKLGGEIDSVGAISAALAGLHPIDYDPTGSKYQIAAAFGTYDGTQAMALGGFYNVNPDILLSLGVSTALKGERKTAGNVGVTFRVGSGKSASATSAPATTKEVQQQLAALKQENNALIDRNANLEDRVAAQDKKLDELEAQMKALLAAAPSAPAKAPAKEAPKSK